MLVELSQDQLALLSDVLEGERDTVGNFIEDNEVENEDLLAHYKDLSDLEEYIDLQLDVD